MEILSLKKIGIISILLLFGGALIVAFAVSGKQNVLQDGLNIIVAIILFIFGGFAILSTLIFEQDKAFTNGLLYGSACIAMGVFLCMHEFILLNYLVYLLAIFFIVIGGVELIRGVILIITKFPKIWLIVITFIVAAIFIAGGILAIIYRENVTVVFCIIAGVLLFAAGAFELIFGIKGLIEQAKLKNQGQQKKVGRQKKEKAEPAAQEEQDEESKDEPVEQIETQGEVKELDYTSEGKE